MLNKYRGVILFTKIYKERDLYIKFLSDTDEVISGIVYGGLSKKKRNIYQIGFYLNFEVYFKPNRPSSINAELTTPYIAKIINDKYKLHSLLCVVSLINLSIIEGQKIKNIYKTVDHFLIEMFESKKWLIKFCIFLFKLLKIIGYEIDYSSKEKYKYFDLNTLEFREKQSTSSILFPYNMLKNYATIDEISISHVFKIFETVFIKHHLSNFNLRLPNHYQLFKKLIIHRIRK